MWTGEQGRQAERIAEDYLVKEKGFLIRERNYRFSRYEIDLIAEDERFLRIVEVKSLTSSVFKQPYESVDRKKKLNLIKAAAAYVRREKIRKEVVFDVVSIVFSETDPVIEYLPEAFSPIWI